MLVHIVMAKLKDSSPEHIAETRDLIMGLEGKVPTLKHIEVGIDITRNPKRSYDLVLYSHFDSVADWEAYQVHPVHQEIGGEFVSRAADVVVVDYVR